MPRVKPTTAVAETAQPTAQVIDLMQALKDSLATNPQPTTAAPEPVLDTADLDELPADPEQKAALDNLCTRYREVKDKIKDLAVTETEIKKEMAPLLESMPLARRTFGEGWELRKTRTERRTIKEDKLKIKLLALGLALADVKALVEEVTDTSVSESWSVYARKMEEDE